MIFKRQFRTLHPSHARPASSLALSFPLIKYDTIFLIQLLIVQFNFGKFMRTIIFQPILIKIKKSKTGQILTMLSFLFYGDIIILTVVRGSCTPMYGDVKFI